MTQQLIVLGTVANDNTGDPLRTGGDKINDNFDELYALQPGTINAAAIDFAGAGSTENKIQAASDFALSIGAPRVWVPSSMLLYNPSLITFSRGVRITREGGSSTDYDVLAYGAHGNGVTDDTVAFQSAMDATPGGGRVYVPPGNYLISSTLQPNNGTLIEGLGAGDVEGSTLIFTGGSGACIQIGTSTVNLNYRNRVANLAILLHQKDSIGIEMRQTQGCILDNLYIEGDVSHGFGSRTNIGVAIDGLNASSYYNILTGVLCSHCHIGFKIYSTGTSYATQTTFVSCSAFGDYGLGDTTGIGMHFTRDPVVTPFIGNGDGSAVLGGNFESYNVGIKIEGGPVQVYGARMEACSTYSVHLTNTSGRNHIDANRLTNGGPIQNDGIPGSMNVIRESDMGGWRGFMRYSPTGSFQIDPGSGSEAHELHSIRNGTNIYHSNTFGAGYTGYFIQSLISTAAATSFVHESYSSNAVDVAYLYGNGNWVNVNNSYGALSDARLKEDIEPAKSQLEDVKLLARAMSKFRLKADHTATRQLGWVAQDIQPISPGLIYSVPTRNEKGEPTGEETLAIHHSVASLKAFKALGELIEKVESLEAEVAVLRQAS